MWDAFATALLRGLARLPLGAVHRLGAAVGLALWVAPTDSRRVAHRNLAICLPALTPDERRRMLRACLMETGKGLLEAGPLWLWPPDRVLGLVQEVIGEEALETAFAAGRGVVLLAPHLGCWELAGLYCSTRYPLTSLYRPFRMKGVDELMRTARERAGARLVPATGTGVRALRRALARGEAVGILPDQDPAVGAGVFAPFFGVTAHTMTLVPRLLHQSGAPAFFVFAERLGSGSGFRLHFTRADPALADPRIEVAATSLNRGVERCILDSPAQYVWVYKRFKTRPGGEESPYPRPVLLAWLRRLRRRWRKRRAGPPDPPR